MMTTLSSVFALAQTGGTAAAEPASPGIVGLLIGAVVTALIGGAVCGLILMLLSGPIGKVKVGFGPAFKTMFVVALIAGVVGALLTLVLGGLASPIQLVLFFVLTMMMISKNHSITMGRSAAIGGIMVAIAIVLAIVVGIVLGILLVALGMAGGAK